MLHLVSHKFVSFSLIVPLHCAGQARIKTSGKWPGQLSKTLMSTLSFENDNFVNRPLCALNQFMNDKDLNYSSDKGTGNLAL